MAKASVIFYGGEIITMDDNNTRKKEKRGKKIEAVAVSGDTIVEVGTIEKVFARRGPNTQMILLNGQTLMPGFIEPHQHAISCCLKHTMYIDISGVTYKNAGEVSKAMKDELQSISDSKSDKWGVFFGWDPELIQDLPMLSSTFLDNEFSSDIPIIIIGQSGHVAWANTKAFTVSDIPADVANPPGATYVRDEDDILTGQMFEPSAFLPLIVNAGSPTATQIKKAITQQFNYYASVGLTTVTDLGYIPNPAVDPFVEEAADNNCPVRVGLYRMTTPLKDPTSIIKQKGAKRAKLEEKPEKPCCGTEIHTACIKNVKAPQKRARSSGGSNGSSSGYADGIGNYNEFLWEAGIKIVQDGSPHCGTMAIREPFLSTPLTANLGFPTPPQYGALNHSNEALYDTIKRLNAKGKQIAVHCHGERACESILKVYEQLQSENDDATNKYRNRLEHCGLMTVEQIARAGKINTALSFFVDHLRFYANVYKTDIFGDRVNRWTPLSEATKSGVTWTIHQDHPTYPGEAAPFANIKTAMTRCHRDDPDHPYGPEYRVSIDEALKAYTINAAWQLHLDDKLGTITKGKKADFVILSDNPYLKDPFELEDINVVETFISGRRNNIGKLTTLAPGINVLRRDTDKYD